MRERTPSTACAVRAPSLEIGDTLDVGGEIRKAAQARTDLPAPTPEQREPAR